MTSVLSVSHKVTSRAVVTHEYLTVDKGHVFNPQDAVRRSYWHLECNMVSTWANLTADIYRRNNHHDNRNMHLFVTMVSRVLELVRLRVEDRESVIELDADETIEPTAELLSCMADALRWSLMYSRPDCGAYMALPWIKDIFHCYQSAQSATNWRTRQPILIPLTEDESIRPTFFLILRLLEASLHHQLITGDTTASDFEQLLAVLGHPELPPLPADLTPEALAARRLDEPPIAMTWSLDGPEVSSCTP